MSYCCKCGVATSTVIRVTPTGNFVYCNACYLKFQQSQFRFNYPKASNIPLFPCVLCGLFSATVGPYCINCNQLVYNLYYGGNSTTASPTMSKIHITWNPDVEAYECSFPYNK